MNIYNYKQDTKEFVSQTEATENPLVYGEYLIPANATTIEVIEEKEGYVRVFNVLGKLWEYTEDNRGTIVYNTTTKEESTIDYLGPIKEGYTDLIPGEFDVWNGSTWETDIKKYAEYKVRELETAYNLANQENIEYMDTVFQADKASQELIASNLSVGSVPDGFYWRDLYDNDVTMTYEDLQGLASAIQVRGLDNFSKYQGLKLQVNSATTVEEIETIVW